MSDDFDCPQCGEEMDYIVDVTRDGMPYVVDLCESCGLETGLEYRPEVLETLALGTKGSQP